MGCGVVVDHRPEDDDEEIVALRSSVRREELAKLPERQLRKRLCELGSKLDLDKCELLDWVLFRNALLLIFGEDDSQIGVALKAIKELQLDRESVTAALVALRPMKDQANKKEYRKWASQLEPEAAHELLQKVILRKIMLRSARGFLLYGGNLILQAMLREWRGICGSTAWKGAGNSVPDDADIGDEGPRMLGEGRDEIFSRDGSSAMNPPDEKPNGLFRPDTQVFPACQPELDALIPDDREEIAREAQLKEPDINNQCLLGNTACALSTVEITLVDQDAVPDLVPSPSKRAMSPQKRAMSRVSRSSSMSSRASEFDTLDAELNVMLEDNVFDTLTAGLSAKEKSQPFRSNGSCHTTNFMQTPDINHSTQMAKIMQIKGGA